VVVDVAGQDVIALAVELEGRARLDLPEFLSADVPEGRPTLSLPERS
jgi:hypothetical protein